MTAWRAIAERWADGMMASGAAGVALMGSHARGDADRLSDVDIVGIGSGEATFRLVDGVIVSSSWVTAEEARAGFDTPHRLGFVVPGWRTAVPLRDPDGVVAGLRTEAEAWTWTDAREQAGRAYLAHEVTHYCEEVFLLVRVLDARPWPASVIRSVFALRSAGLVASRFGLLYETEKDLWELVARDRGDEWRALQDAAFGLGGVTPRDSAIAGLDLFRLLAAIAAPDLGEHQRPVVELALAEIERVRASDRKTGPAPPLR